MEPTNIILPSSNPTTSYWQNPPNEKCANFRSSTTLPEDADVLIIGAGITGVSAAYRLCSDHPHQKVVLLEARQTCSGATGRNGGHLKLGRYLGFKHLVSKYGIEEAIKLLTFERQNARELCDFVKEHDIDCDLSATEGLDVFFDRTQFDAALASVGMMNKLLDRKKRNSDTFENGLPVPKVWDMASARTTFKIPNTVGVITSPAHTFSPYKFVCALMEMALEKGLNLQTNTPVLSIEPTRNSCSTARKWTVRTPRGEISTDNIILATNAYSGQICPSLQKFILPCRGQVVAQRPNAALLLAGALERSFGVVDEATCDHYLICRPPGSGQAGDIILGGARGLADKREEGVLDDSTINSVVSGNLRREVRKLFGRKGQQSREGEEDTIMEWTGIMGMTRDDLPLVGEVEDQEGLFVCAGFNGHGMPTCFLSAKAAVYMVMRIHDSYIRDLLPDSFRLSRQRLQAIAL